MLSLRKNDENEKRNTYCEPCPSRSSSSALLKILMAKFSIWAYPTKSFEIASFSPMSFLCCCFSVNRSEGG